MSMSSIAGAAWNYDGILRKESLTYHTLRWQMEDPYYKRMKYLAQAHNFIFDVLQGFNAPVEPSNIYIAIEEPWPLGIVKKADSGWLKQQAQLQGAFMGGLLAYGFTEVYEVNNYAWKGVMTRQAGEKVQQDKWQAKRLMIERYDLPDLPDLIRKAGVGLIPQPETSRAKPVQPEDLYDAAGLMTWMVEQLA